jgi:hypothetical protein
MSASSFAWVESRHDWTGSYTSKKYMENYPEWERKQLQKLEDERKNDPKTFVGWALKGLK